MKRALDTKHVPARILVVEDDARTRELLQSYLREMGLEVLATSNGEQLESILARHTVDLVVLDIMLPGEDGLSLCSRLRAKKLEVPIIMLTAMRGDADRIVGLELGADDYLPKPFNPRELVARIKAVLRRGHRPSEPAAAVEDRVIRFGGCELNLDERTLTKSGKRLPLTTGEFTVLEALVRYPRRPLSREKLLQSARGSEHEALDRSMDVQIFRLRRLIEDDSAKPRFIQTVWGFGYVFVPDSALP